ncbi:uncharacterized protein LOC121878284 [Homarus americanus]|uniref:Uncharacterized protein n=1 Tax=Homarus americanus TaxID=6706 RepID=A0A8J5NBE3_HOMAM|nr:uncharacterized protein LOC121878284 [Homarus americanus]KAG7176424.1 hypothetical protein Hamer_G009238 [Homarus americanus]
MAAKLSNSWSFFSGRRNQNKDYLNQDYQPNTPSSRVNLQKRFSHEQEKEGRWRRGPLPPPPTHNHGHTSDYQQWHHHEAKKPSQTNPNSDHVDIGHYSNHYGYPKKSTGNCNEHPKGLPNYKYPQQYHPQHQGHNSRSQSPRTSHTFPRRPLRKLPSGVAPLWNNIQDNVSQLKPQTSKLFHEGGRKMNRALQGVRTSLSSLTQIFRNSTRRRYKLGGETPTRTPGRTPRHTPGKLYSPFDLSTPATPHSYAKGPKRLQNATARRNIYGNENRAMIRTPQRHHNASRGGRQWNQFHSPSQSLQCDVTAVNRGLKDLEYVSSGILHNGKENWTQFR